MRLIIIAALLFCNNLTAAFLTGQNKNHDRFFISTNIGYARVFGFFKHDSMPNDDGFNDNGLCQDYRIGWAIYKDLIVSLDMAGIFAAHSKDFDVFPQFDGPMITTQQYIYGFGITNYFQPYNIFSSISFGKSFVIFEQQSQFHPEYLSKSGYGFLFKSGKEFWISANWGLGLSCYYAYGKASFDSDWLKGIHTNQSLGVMISATYN